MSSRFAASFDQFVTRSRRELICMLCSELRVDPAQFLEKEKVEQIHTLIHSPYIRKLFVRLSIADAGYRAGDLVQRQSAHELFRVSDVKVLYDEMANPLEATLVGVNADTKSVVGATARDRTLENRSKHLGRLDQFVSMRTGVCVNLTFLQQLGSAFPRSGR